MASNEVKLRLSVDGAAQVVGDVDRVGNKLGTLDSRARQAAQGADTLNTALGAMATMGSVYAMVKMADAVTTLNTQLRLSSNSAAEAAKAYTSLFDIAQKGRVSFVELGTTYAAIARSGKELGVSQERLLTVTQSISQAMTIGGGSAASMQAALVQLGQGLSSGVLRGEELNSIMEQTPRLAKALADGLGVPIGKLRELGAAGQLTGEQVIAALEKAGPQLAKEMESATLTVGQAFTVLTNSVTNFIGIADAASGASGTLAGALKGVSGSIDTVGKAIKENETAFGLITGGLAGAATAVGLALLVKRIYEARTAVVALGVAAAANPVVLAIAAVGAAVGTMAAAADKFTNSAQGMRAEIGSLNNSIANIDATMAKGADKESVAARASSAILRQQLVEKRDAVAQRLAMLGQVEEGEGRFSQAIDKFNRESAKSEEELIALRQKASGVSADYLPTLEKYQTLLKNGKLEEKEYVELVSALAVKNYKKADSIKAVMAAKKELKDYDAHVHEFTKGNLKAIEDAEKANAKALAEVTKEHEKYIGTLEKSADTIAAQVLKLQDEEAASIIAASQYISLAQAIEQVTIARLQSQADQLSLNGNDAGASAIQREIDERKKLIGLIGGKEAREATAKSAKEAAAEWQKTADKINDSITDALMRGFESGKGFAENLRDTLTNMFKTMVLRPTVSAIVNPVGQAMASAVGFGGGGEGGGGGMIGTALNAASLIGGSTLAAIGSSVATGVSAGLAGTSLAGATAAYSAAGMSGVAGGLSVGSTIGSALAAMGPVGWAALAAGAVLALADHGTPTSSTGDASASFDASGKRTDYQTFFNGSSVGVDKMLADLQAAYAGAAKSLGIGTVASAFAYGGNTGKNGESPNFALTARAGNSFYSTGGETASSDAAIALAASRAVFAALQGSELPGYLSQVFNGLNAGAMTQEQITNTLAYAGSIKQVREALLETREPMAILQSNVDQAFSTLATTSESFKTDFVSAIDGGISPEKLAQWQSLQVAMTELASLAEKEATAKEAAAQKVREAVQREVDKEIATATTWAQKLAVLQGTVTERQLSMQADLATTANAATQELIKQVYAQEDLKVATQTAKDSLKTLSESLKSLSSNVTGAQSSIANLQLQAQIDAANTANAAAEKFRGLNKSLREFLDGETLAPSASFGKLLAKAMGGDSDAMQSLPGAATASIEFAKNRAATSTEFALQKAGILTQVAQAANAAALLAAQTVAVPQAADPMAQAVAALETAVRDLRDGIAQSIGVDLVNRMGEIDTNLSGSIDRLEFGQYFAGLASDATLQSIYGQLDTNGDGQITQLEAIRLATEGTLAEMRLSGTGGIVSGAGTYTGAQALRAIAAAYAAGKTTAQIINDANVNLGVSSAALAPVAAAAGYTEISAYQQRIDATAALSPSDVAIVMGLANSRAGANNTTAESEFVKYLLSQGWNAGMGDKAMGWPLGTTNAWATANGFPAFDVGTNYVPRDMLAQIHEGEAIVPKAYNPAAGGNGRDMARLEALVERLTKEVEGLRSEARATASNTGKTARALDGVINGEDAINTVAA
jgi:tape measure domain-containing protein